jgi:3-deoxy-7-phosphoheptulonate synthase
MSQPVKDEVTVITRKVITPEALKREFARDARHSQCVLESRRAIAGILHHASDRFLAIVGPCSVHDPNATLEYAQRLAEARKRYIDDIELVMRVYSEKPRTTVGWKGLINDPDIDGSCDIERGLRVARQLMLEITGMGLPIAVEFLHLATPHYLEDLVSWGAIGARSTESQAYRELASSLPCPIGFKNGTEGNVQIAIDAICTAYQPHCFLAVDAQGNLARVESPGNHDCHLVLRGGKQPNYDAKSVEAARNALTAAGMSKCVVIDASHGNSRKNHENQVIVCDDITSQLRYGNRSIVGVMIESNLVEGRQSVEPGVPLVYGQSITDSCIGWDNTVYCLDALAYAVRKRRLMHFPKTAALVGRAADPLLRS